MAKMPAVLDYGQVAHHHKLGSIQTVLFLSNIFMEPMATMKPVSQLRPLKTASNEISITLYMFREADLQLIESPLRGQL